MNRFLASGDPTFQHIAIWTLLQLLESEDRKLVDLVSKADDVIKMIKSISVKNVDSDDEDGEDGEEVIALAKRSLELLENGPESSSGPPPGARETIVEG